MRISCVIGLHGKSAPASELVRQLAAKSTNPVRGHAPRDAVRHKTRNPFEDDVSPIPGVVKRQDLRNLHQVWNSILAAIAATGVTNIVINSKGGHYALVGLSKLAKVVVQSYLKCSPDFLYKLIKHACEECRSSALQNVLPGSNLFKKYLYGSLKSVSNSRKGRVQLSMIGRALPLGTDKKLVSSLEDHLKALTTSHRTPKEILDRAFNFGASWGRRHLRLTDLNPLAMDAGGGACTEFTRAEGGNLKDYILSKHLASHEYINGRSNVFEDVGCHPEVKLPSYLARLEISQGVRKRPPGARSGPGGRSIGFNKKPRLPKDVKLNQFQIHVRSKLCKVAPLSELSLETFGALADFVSDAARYKRGPSVLEGIVVPTRERGNKCRIVSKHSAAPVRLAHKIRKMLFAGLQRDSRVSGVIEGDHHQAVREVFKDLTPHTHDHLILSSDLSAASDLLPHDLIEALVGGLLRGLEEKGQRVPDWASEVLKSMTGPLNLSWPQWGSTKSGFAAAKSLSSRGIMMGLPTTWALLCIVHLFWIDVSCEHRPSLKERAAVCGDDLLAYWPQDVIETYHSLLAACGAKISQGKHFVFPDGGVFTEKCFHTRKTRIPINAAQALKLGLAGHEFAEVTSGVRFFDSPSLKGLVAPSGNRPLPRWLTLGSTVESLVSNGISRPTVMRAVDVLYPGHTAFYFSKGIPALPRQLGGSGLFRGDPRLRSFPKTVRLPAKICVFGKSLKSDKDAFASLWSVRVEMPDIRPIADFWYERNLNSATFCRYGKSCAPSGLQLVSSIDEFRKVLRLKADLYAQATLRRAETGREIIPQLSVLAKRFAQARKKLFESWRGVRDVYEGLRVSDLLRALYARGQIWSAWVRGKHILAPHLRKMVFQELLSSQGDYRWLE